MIKMIEAEHSGIEVMNEGMDEVDIEAKEIGMTIIRAETKAKEIADAQRIQEELLDAVFGKVKD